MNIESSHNFSTNGDHSLKITANETKYNGVQLGLFSANANEIYTATIDILNNTNNVVQLRIQELNNGVYNTIDIPSNTNTQTVTITRTVTGADTLLLTLIIRAPLTVYIDNVQVNKR